MLLWRLSSRRKADVLDGGYGLSNDGRWNTRGRAVTYCSTVPSLTALEKRAHVTDASLLPPLVMVAYSVPDDISMRRIEVQELPDDWTRKQTSTQAIGDSWLDSALEALLFIPSVIVPIAKAPDRNVLINHRAPDAASITVESKIPFTLDPRLFKP